MSRYPFYNEDFSFDKEKFDKWSDEMIAKTEHWVEANSCEQQYLWKDFGPESILKKHSWEQEGMGIVRKLGELDNMPVNISISWAYIDGHLVGFYYSPSMVTDYRMLDEFIKKTGKQEVDAMNFHNCIRHLEG